MSITAYPYFTVGVLYNFLYKNNVKALCPQLAVQATVNTLTSNHHSSQAGTPGLTSHTVVFRGLKIIQRTDHLIQQISCYPVDKVTTNAFDPVDKVITLSAL